MRSLTVKLVLAFLVVGLIEALLAAVLVRYLMQSAFDRFVMEEAVGRMVEEVADFYEANGSLDGLERRLRRMSRRGLDRAHHRRMPWPGFLAVVEPDGHVLIRSQFVAPGDISSDQVTERGTPVLVDDTVRAYVIPPPSALPLSRREAAYLQQTDQALLVALAGGMLVALLLGLWLARSTLRPLHELTEAAGALGRGDLDTRVNVRSRDEVGRLARAFNRMSEDLSRGIRVRRQMTADIAHDLRTPLTVITGYLEAMRQGDLEPTADRLETMNAEAQHLKRMIEDLRTLSLADAGELTLERTDVDVHRLMQQVASSFVREAEAGGIHLRLDIDAGMPPARLDGGLLTRALSNLVTNAIRHTPAGGTVRLTAGRDDGVLEILVSDTGSGIAEEDLPYVFDRFYRVDRARSREDGATGLGLAIVHSIVSAHGGRVEAESEPGTGSTFRMRFPLEPESTI